MARLVDNSMRSNGVNTYGRNPNGVVERSEPRMQIVKSYGTVKSTGVGPDGSTCATSVTPTEVEFTLNIYRRGNEYTGEVYIVNYDTRKKVNSNQLIYYQGHDGVYILCIFCVSTTSGYKYELIVNLTSSGGGTNGKMYAYVAPIYTEGINVGGQLTEGEIIFYENYQRNSNLGPICNSLSYEEQQMNIGPNIGPNANNEDSYDEGCNYSGVR